MVQKFSTKLKKLSSVKIIWRNKNRHFHKDKLTHETRNTYNNVFLIFSYSRLYKSHKNAVGFIFFVHNHESFLPQNICRVRYMKIFATSSKKFSVKIYNSAYL